MVVAQHREVLLELAAGDRVELLYKEVAVCHAVTITPAPVSVRVDPLLTEEQGGSHTLAVPVPLMVLHLVVEEPLITHSEVALMANQLEVKVAMEK